MPKLSTFVSPAIALGLSLASCGTVFLLYSLGEASAATDRAAASRKDEPKLTEKGRWLVNDKGLVIAPVHEGYISVTNCNTVSGWIWDTLRPNHAVKVEAFVDGRLRGTRTANVLREDVRAAGRGTGQYGFSFDSLPGLTDGKPHVVSVRVADSTFEIGNSPVRVSCAPHNYVGFADASDCNFIAGWAADHNDLGRPVSVEVWEGATLLARGQADQLRRDVAEYLKDSGQHGFSIPTPVGLKDGKAHQVQVRIAETTTQIQNSPKTNTCAPRYTGVIDQLNCGSMNGWAAETSSPGQSVNVGIWLGSTQLATVTASQPRPDVGAALRDNGNHGFVWQIPPNLKDGATKMLSVRFGGSGPEMAGSPRPLQCSPDGR